MFKTSALLAAVSSGISKCVNLNFSFVDLISLSNT